MKSVKLEIWTLLLTVALAACEGSAGTGGVTVLASGGTLAPTRTTHLTWTPTRTLTPTISPTATQVPDLEIVNARLLDNRYTLTGGIFFLGKIRNNTSTPMLLPAREIAFTFYFEDYQTFGDIFWHDTVGPLGVMPGIFGQSGPQSNCVLYPHEEGVIFFRRLLLEKLDGFAAVREELDEYDGPLGMTYTYTSTYSPAPEMPDYYHPSVENLEYRIDGGVIYFEYDISVPAPKKKGTDRGMVMGFLILYDKNGDVLNVLYHDIRSFLPYEAPYDHLVHMLGQAPGGDVPFQWYRLMEFTKEDLEKVDHVEMFFELQYEGICFEKRYI
ncbi:MAG: hypothetical protein JW929_09835 [Anaerolineales bacterium]|nr:hypothetical protein [Anaerolineales bacterium]